MAEPYCDKFDMLVRDCAHCRGIKDAKPVAPAGNWIYAKYPGRCVQRHRIEPGDLIRKAPEDDGWQCQDCD